jgi:Neuraminidase (sialidase)
MPKPIFNNLLAACIVLLCQGCQTTPSKTAMVPAEISIPATGVSKQHNLSKTADGKLIASWVESKDKINTVRFALFDEGTWQSVRSIVSTSIKLAATPVVLGLSDGSLAAFWMQSVQNENDRYAAEIFWSQSEDDGLTWRASLFTLTLNRRGFTMRRCH